MWDWSRQVEANTSSTSKETEGWLSKYQIADFEKRPVGHPLLNDKLAGLPARAHSCRARADKGEMEYFYTGAKLTKKGEQYVQSSKVKAKGAIKKDHRGHVAGTCLFIKCSPKGY